MSGQASLQSAVRAVLHVVYPPHCLTCNAIVDGQDGLCGSCWRDTPFIEGLVCDLCGVPLPGDDFGDTLHCDDCLITPRPWSKGRSVMRYAANGRRLVLALKHGDRTDLARATSGWMAQAAQDLLVPDVVIAPVPLHWRRLFRRRYNQSALLAQGLARETGATCVPDLLQRTRFTGTQDGKGRGGRFQNVDGAIRVHPRRAPQIKGRPVLVVDDVMTSGATFSACAEACREAGASDIRVLALARVARDD